ncbi:ATP-binding protein [Rhodopseudomonas julia]|nr:ATP-binding protein [Rhodopseudomonas julia]
MLNSPVDLSACDTEPIHMIGAIQPIGCLIAVDAGSLTIEYASTNTRVYFGRDYASLLGLPLAELLGPDGCDALLARRLAPTVPDLLRPTLLQIRSADGEPIELECLPHLCADWLVLEFVWPESRLGSVWDDEVLRQRVISELIIPDTLEDLAQVGAQILRDATGFDRVMIYRFAADQHGEVIAESTVRPDSFLGLHYPASDIPDPARRHFVRNVIRVIADINAEPVPIMTRSGVVADVDSQAPLDLTYSKLRAVAPVHVEYLNNMGVAGSVSISLISENKLWGLVACHNYSPLDLSWSRLRACELIGGTISALLHSLENTSQLRASICAEKTAFAIESEARSGQPLRETIEAHADDLLAQLSAQGMLLKLSDDVLAIGKVPAGHIDYAPLAEKMSNGIATCDQLQELLGVDNLGNDIAGAAMMELSEDRSDWLILFREAFGETIRWAGKPEKITIRKEDGSTRLSPRGSFALWLEERRGHSQPFTETDGEILRITRRALFAVNSLDRERAAMAAMRRAEAEEARLRLMLMDAAQDRSMGELASALAHELNQPLSAVSNYVNASRQELRNHGIVVPAHIGGLMESAVSESARAADLVRRLRNFIGQREITLESVDLKAVVRQGVELALAASNEPRPEIVFDFVDDIPPIAADPVQIVQVILNLARNSITAMAGSKLRRLTLSIRNASPLVEISIHDTGTGVPQEMEDTLFEPFHNSTTSGMGLGLSLCRSIVEAHGGRIWMGENDKGATFVFTLRITGPDDA